VSAGTQCLFVDGVRASRLHVDDVRGEAVLEPVEPDVVSPEEASPVRERRVRELVKHYAGFGIVLDEVGALTPSEPSVHCLACGCARGDSSRSR